MQHQIPKARSGPLMGRHILEAEEHGVLLWAISHVSHGSEQAEHTAHTTDIPVYPGAVLWPLLGDWPER